MKLSNNFWVCICTCVTCLSAPLGWDCLSISHREAVWFPLSLHLLILSRLILVGQSVVIFAHHTQVWTTHRVGRLPFTRHQYRGPLLCLRAAWQCSGGEATPLQPPNGHLSVFICLLASCALQPWHMSDLPFPLRLFLPIHRFLFPSLPVCLHIPIVLYTSVCPCTCLSDLAL